MLTRGTKRLEDCLICLICQASLESGPTRTDKNHRKNIYKIKKLIQKENRKKTKVLTKHLRSPPDNWVVHEIQKSY